jgi:hypothetical protein
MGRNKSMGQSKALLLLLTVLTAVALVLAVTLILIILKQNSAQGSQGEILSPTSDIQNDDLSQNQQDSTYAENEGGELPIIGLGGDRSSYSIEFQDEIRISGSEADKIEDEFFDYEIDLDRDGYSEKYRISFTYDDTDKKTQVNLLAGSNKAAGAVLENTLESSDCVDIILTENNSGTGLGVICKTFDENDNKYVLQCIVWEYVNDVLTEQWNLVYTARADEGNGYMKDGYIRGLIRGEQVDYTTDSHMNGFILIRSTFMADMKNLGIKLPKDTTGECTITYTHYAQGLVRIIIE